MSSPYSPTSAPQPGRAFNVLPAAQNSTTPNVRPSNAFYRTNTGTQLPVTPPPVIGGNRSQMHTVGGRTTNVGYSQGANLAASRTMYQNAQARGTQIGHNGPNAMSAGFFKNMSPNPQGNAAHMGQLRGNTKGQARGAGSPYGMGYQQTSGAPVRQHTLNPGAGGTPHWQEIINGNMSYTPPPPPPGPAAAAPAPAPAAKPAMWSPEWVASWSVGADGVGRSPHDPGGYFGGKYYDSLALAIKAKDMAAAFPGVITGPTTAQDQIGGVAPGTPAPMTVQQQNQQIRQQVAAGGGLKVGNFLPGEVEGTKQKITGLKKYGNVWLPLVGEGANQHVHAAWRELMS